MPLVVGVPKEIKPMEGRIALTPDAVADLVAEGITVLVQASAGDLSGFDDDAYRRAGARLVDDAAALYGNAQLIVKVKEPVEGDLQHLRSDHLLFCYLHLAPNPVLTQALLSKKLTGVAFETVEVNGRLPLLAPMSEIAGRVAVQAASHYLHGSMGGCGLLLGGVAGTSRGRVVVLGAGMAGKNAAQVAAALGAEVLVFDKNTDALREVEKFSPLIKGLYMSGAALRACLPDTDILVGAVLVPGARAPKLVTRELVKLMPKGSVIVDISIDQGGCVETMRVTDYRNPVFVEEGVVHMGVANLPGAVPKTSAAALSGVIAPYVHLLAHGKLDESISLQKGVNVRAGVIVHPAILQN